MIRRVIECDPYEILCMPGYHRLTHDGSALRLLFLYIDIVNCNDPSERQTEVMRVLAVLFRGSTRIGIDEKRRVQLERRASATSVGSVRKHSLGAG